MLAGLTGLMIAKVYEYRMADLTITNGDTAAELLAEAGIEGDILPWRDVLHEGPVVATASLEELSELRCRYLAERFNLDPDAVWPSFRERDAAMRDHQRFDRIAIWLEHDLYDQLQLLQVLASFAGEQRTEGVALVQADDFLGVQDAQSILRFQDKSRAVDQITLDLAQSVWSALTEPSPAAVSEQVAEPIGALAATLPFVPAAIRRFLAELPAPESGLSRTEEQVLLALAGGHRSAGELFREVLAEEEAAFMGDWSFFAVLDDLAFCQWPLVEGVSDRFNASGDPAAYGRQSVSITEFGRMVLSDSADHVAANGIDRWWAGTRLSNGACWRYDRKAGRLLRPGAMVEARP